MLANFIVIYILITSFYSKIDPSHHLEGMYKQEMLPFGSKISSNSLNFEEKLFKFNIYIIYAVIIYFILHNTLIVKIFLPFQIIIELF